MLLWTSDWRTRFMVQFSVWVERARAWRYQPAVKDCNCCASAIMSQRTGHFRSLNLPWNTVILIRGKSLMHTICLTMGPIKMHLMNIMWKKCIPFGESFYPAYSYLRFCSDNLDVGTYWQIMFSFFIPCFCAAPSLIQTWQIVCCTKICKSSNSTEGFHWEVKRSETSAVTCNKEVKNNLIKPAITETRTTASSI